MLWLLLSLSLLLALAYQRASLRTTTAALAALLLAYAVFGPSLAIFGLALLVFAIVFVPVSLPTFREEWLTRPLLERFQRLLPPERAARVAGIRLGQGQRERRVFGDLGDQTAFMPRAAALSVDEELRVTLDSLGVLSAREPGLSPPMLANLRAQRLFALALPAEHGGLGHLAQVQAAALHELAAMPGGYPVASLLAFTASAAGLLLQHGTDEQKAQLLPQAADGSLLPIVAQASLWNRNRGAGAGTAPDRGVVRRGIWKGREVLGLQLSFDKTAVPFAAQATDFLVSVQISDPEGLLGPGAPTGHALVRVPRDAVEIEALRSGTRRDDRMPLSTLSARDAFVPVDRLVGGVAASGHADAALDSANAALGAAFAALAAGDAALALRSAAVQARVIAQYRLQVPRSATLHRAIADAALDVYGLDALQHFLGEAIDEPASPGIAALAAAFAAEVAGGARGALRVIDPQHAAAVGDPAGAANIERLMPGAGAMDELVFASFPSLHRVLDAAVAQPYGLAFARFDASFWPLLGDVFAHQSHALLLTVTDGRIARIPPETSTRKHWRRLARYRAALASCCDAWQLGREPGPADGSAENHLREAFSATLMLTAALQYFADTGHSRDELPLLDAFCDRCCRRIEAGIDGFIFQQRSRVKMALLRLILLPTGRLPPRPDDALHARIAGWVMAPGPIRERLFRGVHRSHDAVTASALFERVEAALAAALPAQRRLDQLIDSGQIAAALPLQQITEAAGRGLVSTEEAETLRAACNVVEDLRRYSNQGTETRRVPASIARKHRV